MSPTPHRNLLATVAAAALFLTLGSTAQAGMPSAPVCHVLNGGSVQINECVADGKGDYTVTNNSAYSLFGLYISADGASNYSPWTVRSGWSATRLTEAEFNANNPLHVGDFDSWFGTSDNVVNVYTLPGGSGTGSPISSNSQASGFYFYAIQPTSNFVALNAAGNVVAQSFSAAVPEASTLGMMTFGLAGVALMMRRRRMTTH